MSNVKYVPLSKYHAEAPKQYHLLLGMNNNLHNNVVCRVQNHVIVDKNLSSGDRITTMN